MWGREDKMAEARRCRERHSFAGPEGHSANLEAWRYYLITLV